MSEPDWGMIADQMRVVNDRFRRLSDAIPMHRRNRKAVLAFRDLVDAWSNLGRIVKVQWEESKK